MRKYKDLFDKGGWWLSVEAAGSFHPGGLNASMADGSVRFIKDTIAYNIWIGIATASGGEVISADSL